MLINFKYSNYIMIKTIILICLYFLPFACVSQDLDCDSNISAVFKVQELKIKYGMIQYLYYVKSEKEWNSLSMSRYWYLFSGLPVDFEEHNDSTSNVNSGESSKVYSKEELNRYIERLNCTPGEAFEEYRGLIRKIKSEKENYLNCVDAELAKGDSSEYANKIMPYKFWPPGWSVIPPWDMSINKLGFLKVFKEFILNDDNDFLPDGVIAYAFLKCNCKIP